MKTLLLALVSLAVNPLPSAPTVIPEPRWQWFEDVGEEQVFCPFCNHVFSTDKSKATCPHCKFLDTKK